MNTKEEKLLKITSVLEYIEISKSKLYQMMKDDNFPSPVKIGGSSLWRLSDIQCYINSFKTNKAS